ncbi:deleted in azoospermia protein 4-like isoform X2 [Acanthaster planci]|uniref:Deleted in azoospermia protein 4-like isoform X2 n=1 Tax=Acanthaster planci TaxID=133434 RepID=A0A8B7XJ76_ACAPL|nr:deleted in azoospermia protein 4-like isoform X2 [Acanthaster planci]
MTEVQSGPADGSNSSTASSPIPSAPNAPKYGTMIPNRIFVGGISFNTCEAELKNFFSHYGRVKETKIIADRAGVSKGYAFITFESQEEAVRILKEQANNLVFKDKKLNIGQAIRKQPMNLPKNVDPALIPSGMVLTSPLGYSYTYHNGVAYFNPAEVQGPPTHGHHPPATAVIPHHHTQHHPVNPSMAYPQYTVPVMVQAPPTSHSHHQYLPVTSQPQQGQYYQQPINTTPQWTTIPGQWRWVHPQAASGLTSGMVSPLYATTPGTDMAMYPAPTPAYAQTPADVPEMPLMEPSQNEGAIISMDSLQPQQQQQQMPSHHHTHPPPPPPLPLVAAHLPPPRPYLPPEMAYPEPSSAMPHLLPKMPIHQNRFAPKRTIKMPRRDRAPKMVRSTVDGLHYTLAQMDDHPPTGVMAINGYPTTIAPAK